MGTTPTSGDVKQMVTGLYYISSIDVKTDNVAPIQDDEIILTCSNYGVASIYYCTNGTASSPVFNSIDNVTALGDVPIRCSIFAPNNNAQNIKVLLGTELGVGQPMLITETVLTGIVFLNTCLMCAPIC